ncbi:MAG: hypothetical protein ACC628_00495 [Pirellulaceae bacterium]
MKRLRLACAAFVGWLFVLFDVERIHEPINIASFVYVIAAVIGVVIVWVKPLGSVSLRWLLTVPLATFFVIKLTGGHAFTGQAMPMMVVEICAITVTVAIAHQIAFRLYRLDKASVGMITDGPERQPVTLWAAQTALYREMRRARQHGRPLTALAVASAGHSVDSDEARVLRELERELLDKYTNARIAALLAAEAKDHGIVTHCNRHFVVLLPETDRLAADQVVRRLRSSVETTLGLKLKVGVSTFPDEEVTLVGMLQRAEASMRNGDSVERHTREQANKTQTTSATAPVQVHTTHEPNIIHPSLADTATDLQATRDTAAAPLPRTSQ